MKVYRNTSIDNRKLYESIMRDIKPQIRRALLEAEKEPKNLEEDELDEDQLNELFGFGESVDKPEKALSLKNTDEENAELFIQWCGYFMSKAGNNVAKGLNAFFEKFGEVLVKLPKLIVKGVLMLMSGTIKGVTFGITTVASVILGSIFTLVRLAKSGVENAVEALKSLYKQLSQGIAKFYEVFTKKSKDYATSSKDTLQRWCGIMAGALMAVANKVESAAEYLKDIFVKILKDAKEGVQSAILITKTWLSAKAQEVKDWINEVAGNIREAVAKAWNATDKAIRKTYNKAVEKLEGWMQSIKDAIEFAAQKMKEAGQKAKDFVVDKKDKTLLYGISKAVKGLSKNYSEDEVVAIVRKAYNENLRPMYNGNYMINEKYFYNKNVRNRRYRLV